MGFSIVPNQEIRKRDQGISLEAVHTEDPGVAISISISYSAIARRAGREVGPDEAADLVAKNLRYFLPLASKLKLRGRTVGDDGYFRIWAEDID